MEVHEQFSQILTWSKGRDGQLFCIGDHLRRPRLAEGHVLVQGSLNNDICCERLGELSDLKFFLNAFAGH